MAHAQRPRGGPEKPKGPADSQVDEMLKAHRLEVDPNKPLRKALLLRDSAVWDSLEGCFAILKSPGVRKAVTELGDELKRLDKIEKTRLGVSSVGKIPLKKRREMFEIVAKKAQSLKDLLMASDATGVRIPTWEDGGSPQDVPQEKRFTNMDNRETRWRIVDMAVNTVIISRANGNVSNAEELLDAVLNPKSLRSREFKEMLKQQARAASF